MKCGATCYDLVFQINNSLLFLFLWWLVLDVHYSFKIFAWLFSFVWRKIFCSLFVFCWFLPTFHYFSCNLHTIKSHNQGFGLCNRKKFLRRMSHNEWISLCELVLYSYWCLSISIPKYGLVWFEDYFSLTRQALCKCSRMNFYIIACLEISTS